MAISLGIGQRAFAADQPGSPPETPAQKDARLKWWSDARFGMFIHWGVYSVPAGEWDGKTNYAEWFLEETHMPVSQYEKYADQFNPTNFDARAWVRAAKNAGVKYIVITSKHHDGFAMYPTKLSDWSISRTPFKRDPIAELAAACKAEGIHFCLYYTIMDWHSSDWGIRRAWNDVAAASGHPPDMDHFEDYMKGQLHELLTNYGPIGLLWFDGNWESPWTARRGQEIYDYVRSLQPAVIVNNRVGKPENTSGGGFAKTGAVGDYGTPEQTIPPTGFGPGVYWESCMTMNDHWGYNKADQNFKSTKTLVHNLIDCASKGGNYLLNVGPTSAGIIPAPELERLKEMGDWMKVNSVGIYDTSASPFKKLPWGRCTSNVDGNTTTLYLHIFNWPANGQLLVPGLKNKTQKAWLLADKSKHKLAVNSSDDGVTIALPSSAPDPISTTVVLRIKGPLVIEPQPEPKATASNVYQNQTDDYGPQFAFDGDDQTRWATDDATKQAWIAIELLKPGTFHGVRISEAYAGRVQKFEFQYRDGGDWKTIFSGTTLGENFTRNFDDVTAKEFRLNILDATQGPTINEIDLLPK